MSPQESSKPHLTHRELEILQLAWDGLDTAQISKLLLISAKTVEYHRSEMYKKIGAHNLVTALRKALQHGLLKP